MVCKILIPMCISVEFMHALSRHQDLKTLKVGLYMILSAGAIRLMVRNASTLDLDLGLEKVSTWTWAWTLKR